MYFFALSQAPPPLFRKVAMRMPAMVPTIRSAATASAPDAELLEDQAHAIGVPTATRPGRIICLSAPRVTMSTVRP